ncbi:MAG: carboxypeptidase-like regulatory domain-containing protein, partial [Bacteroidota bacterium]
MSARTVLIFLFLIPQLCFAKEISGKVLDSVSGEPVAFANVFFAGSLNGTTTDLDGNFLLTLTERGKYELIVSYVGYNQFSMLVEFEKDYLGLEIKLEPEVVELDDIYVNADTTGWQNNYPAFRREFLGGTTATQKVEIANPKDIFLYYDAIDRGLFAHSRKEIIIENNALGYRLIYIMKDFQVSYKTGQFLSLGIPRFEEMKSKRKGQVRKWNKARKKAYLGSFNHFLQSVVSNTFVDDGYIVREVHKVPNRDRPPQELIDKKLSAFRSTSNVIEFQNSTIVIEADSLEDIPENISIPESMRRRVDSLRKAGLNPRIAIGGKGNNTNNDSLRYWNSMQRLPLTVDSLSSPYTSNELLLNDQHGALVHARRSIHNTALEADNERMFHRVRP